MLLNFKGFSQSNEVGIIPFKIEKTSETFQESFERKFTGGVYYNRYFEKFHWSTEFIIGKNKINDFCTNCLETSVGDRVYRELSLASGVGLRIHGEKHSGLTGNIRLLFYGAMTSYSGTFINGQIAWYFDVDNRYYLLGGQLQYDLSYIFKAGLLVGIDAAFKLTKTKPRIGDFLSLSSYIPPSVYMVTLPSFRIGYQF